MEPSHEITAQNLSTHLDPFPRLIRFRFLERSTQSPQHTLQTEHTALATSSPAGMLHLHHRTTGRRFDPQKDRSVETQTCRMPQQFRLWEEYPWMCPRRS